MKASKYSANTLEGKTRPYNIIFPLYPLAPLSLLRITVTCTVAVPEFKKSEMSIANSFMQLRADEQVRTEYIFSEAKAAE